MQLQHTLHIASQKNRDKQDNFRTKCQHNATYKRKLGDREHHG